MSLIVPIPVAALQNYLLHEVPQKLDAMIHVFVVMARNLRNAVVRIYRETMQTKTLKFAQVYPRYKTRGFRGKHYALLRVPLSKPRYVLL